MAREETTNGEGRLERRQPLNLKSAIGPTVLSIVTLLCTKGLARAQIVEPPVHVATQPVYGPAIPGLCVFSRDAAIDNSIPGQAATKRMLELTTQVNAEFQPERDAIAKEKSTLSDPKLVLPDADLKSRKDALASRTQALNLQVQTRNDQLIRTRQDALVKLDAALRPVLVTSITDNKCSAVLERSNVYGFNGKIDITPEVTDKLSGALEPFSFDLVSEEKVAPKP